MNQQNGVLDELMEVIESRRGGSPEESYTSWLLSKGIGKIAEKIVEEAAEVVEAAAQSGEAGREHLICEAADLLYHLMVMLACRDSRLEEVEAELARRFGVSGLAEKASRPPKPSSPRSESS